MWIMILFIKKILNKLSAAVHFVRKKAQRAYKKQIKKQIKDISENFLSDSKTIYVFGSPYHSNLGDQAQSYCIDLWLSKNYLDYKHFIIDSLTLTKNDFDLLKLISKNIRKEDIVFLHSGYHLTDLYPLENNLIIKTVQLFTENPVILLPQTINYSSKYDFTEIKLAFKRKKDILLLCRDEESFLKSQEIFINTHSILFPDIVTTMIGNFGGQMRKKEGVLLCIRNDIESFYSENQIRELISKIERESKVSIIDTSISLHPYKIIKNRGKILRNMWKYFSKHKLVITDRYHGTIFSLIGNTPVIVLGTTDHKLKSGVKWFPDSFSKYVFFANNLEEAYEISASILQNYQYVNLPNYFESTFYDRLKGIINENI